jgi:hypothetical protein
MNELNTIQLHQLLANEKKASRAFKGVFAIDQLPKIQTVPSSLIFNTDLSTGPGQHWCAIYWDSNHVAYYYDPYGMHPQTYNMTSYLNKFSKRWVWNRIQNQSFNSSLCGYFCFLFLIFKSRNIRVRLNDRIIKHYFKL